MGNALFKLIKIAGLKIRIITKIIFSSHYLVLRISRDQLIELIKDSEISGDVKVAYQGLMPHHVKQIIKLSAAEFDDTDIICEKASFEVKVCENLNIPLD